ncbi:GNAT family N-acetyltransferase [Thiocapsa rosea]|uniref:Acetyltransferase (GNAT) family protein n=1 Tax=Thiocapsa rosea TaxID=69360 RepID=A0A495V9D3_9GAMM|nr:GNAT family N-acetyltransferase [Thiocapsa rosea]RKT45350.1 acetyltransferase (GNAT) family protein [Thiocapsa rosea]
MKISIERARSRASPRGEAVRLKDGTFCRIHPIERGDPEIVTACFDGLSNASRRLRFFGAKRALTEADLAYLTGADGHDHLAFAALRRTVSGGRDEVLGVARCIRSKSGSEPVSETAELAMAVVDQAQGNGVGSALLEHLIEAAREQGIRRFRCEVLADNEGMRALARRLGGHPVWLDDGTLEYDCALPETVSIHSGSGLDQGRATGLLWEPGIPGSPETAPRRGAGAVTDVWTSSWERAANVSIAFFETAALVWYDRVLPSRIEDLNRVQSDMRRFHAVFSVGGFLDLGETRFKV